MKEGDIYMKGRFYAQNDLAGLRSEEENGMEFLKLTSKFLKLMALVVIVMIASMLLCGCRTVKHGVSESRDSTDSVRIEYVEKIVKVPVKVYVEVPAQKQERETVNDSSYLETDFAFSWAFMRWKGDVPYLFHTLENKPQKIEKTDTVPVVEKEKIMWKTRRVTYTKTEYMIMDLAWWQTGLMWVGGISLAAGILIICFFIFVRFFLRR